MVVPCTNVDIQPKVVTQACCRFRCGNSCAPRWTVGKTDGYRPRLLIMSNLTCQLMQPPFAPFGITLVSTNATESQLHVENA